MWDTIREWPPAILHRWLGLLAAGPVCLLVGGAAGITLRDRILLLLSLAVSLLMTGKAVLLCRSICKRGYDTVKGVCIQVEDLPLRKNRRVKLADADGNLQTLFLEKQVRLQIGQAYRFYFKKSDVPTGTSPLSDSAVHDSFLGYEEADDVCLPEKF